MDEEQYAALLTEIASMKADIEGLKQHGMDHGYKGSDPIFNLWQSVTRNPDVPFSITPEGGIAVWLRANGAFGLGDIVKVSGTLGVSQAAANEDMPMGVAYTACKTGDYLWVIHAGIAYVRFKGGVIPIVGHIATVSDEAGHADSSATLPAVAAHNREVGHVLETGAAGGLARCILHWN